MAPNSAIRKAIGVVKDQTRISIAKVTSNFDPQLDILIVKVTSHDDDIVPNDKYMDEILRRSSKSKDLVNECVGLICKRLEKTHDWVVALKCLILVHRLMVDGGEVFMEEIACANASSVKGGGMLSNMCVFKDEAHSNSWEYTEFVRRYGMYLDEKVELMVFDEMWLRRRLRISDGLKEVEDKDKKFELSKLSDEMATKRVLSRMEQLQRLLERVLAIRPKCVNKHQKLVILGLCPVIEESFKLYDDICEGLAFLLDQFWGMEYWNIVKTLGTYVTVAKQIDELVEFYAWCKDFGVVTTSEYPVIEKISDDLLRTMEEFMKKRAVELKSATEKRKKTKMNEADRTSLKVEEQDSSAIGVCGGLGTISQDLGDDFQNFIELDDEDAPNEAQGEISAFFCDDQAIFSSTNPWESASDISEYVKIDSYAQTPVTDSGNADWEVALLESASILMNQKSELGGGFDSLLLDSMYEQQGTVSKNLTCSELNGANASTLALPLQSETAVLALPCSDGPIQMTNQDPFMGSVAVPPPTYVQIAELEKQRELLVHQQQVWQQVGTNGMQCQTDSVQNVSSYYFDPQAMMPYEMPRNMDQPGGQPHNLW